MSQRIKVWIQKSEERNPRFKNCNLSSTKIFLLLMHVLTMSELCRIVGDNATNASFPIEFVLLYIHHASYNDLNLTRIIGFGMSMHGLLNRARVEALRAPCSDSCVRVLACGRPPLSFPPTCCLPRHNYSSWRQLFNDKVSVRASAAARGDCCSSVGIDQVVSVGGAVLATALLTRR